MNVFRSSPVQCTSFIRMLIIITMTLAVCEVPFLHAAVQADSFKDEKSGAQWVIPFGAEQNSPAAPRLLMRKVCAARCPGFAIVRDRPRPLRITVNGQRPGASLINQPWSQYNKTLYCRN
jgi:hypothetical protein